MMLTLDFRLVLNVNQPQGRCARHARLVESVVNLSGNSVRFQVRLAAYICTYVQSTHTQLIQV